jgi:predicted RNA-binding Zn ribbon-like protein
LTLDLLNTRPVLTGKPQELLSDFLALLKWFHAAGLLSSSEVARLQEKWDGSARAKTTLGTIRRLREILRQEILRWETGANIRPVAVRQLNLLMARHPVRSKLTERKDGLAIHTCFEARRPEDLLAPLAQSAAELFTKADRTRVRKCAHCVRHFLDTSKKGTRRWCSMKLCGNRFKVAAYAARRRRHLNS